MKTVTHTPARPSKPNRPAFHFVTHPSFDEPDAPEVYSCPDDPTHEAYATSYMPDEVTREYARKMHYAAYRMTEARNAREEQRWKARYYGLRDAIVIGNRKLVYRAVNRWMDRVHIAEDMIGECHIVLIQAVAAYNPWLGIRFSTYAFTCLMRALSRLSQRRAADRLAQCLSLDTLPGGEPTDSESETTPSMHANWLHEYLDENHSLLTAREKHVIRRRFSLQESRQGNTLEQVGRELGLSKERVRQVQVSALAKLRQVLIVRIPLG